MKALFRIFTVTALAILLLTSCALPQKSFFIEVPPRKTLKPSYLVLTINRGKKWGIEKRFFHKDENQRWFLLKKKNFQDGDLIEARGVETNRDYVLFTDISVLYEFKKDSEIKSFNKNGFKLLITFSDMGIDNAESYVQATLKGILISKEKHPQCFGLFNKEIRKDSKQNLKVTWKDCFS
jgi:uncharacterized protein YxeA